MIDASKTDGSIVRVEKDGTAGKSPETDDAATVETAMVPLEQVSEINSTAARLGLCSDSTVTVVFPLSEQIQRLLGAQTHELSAKSTSLWTKLYEIIDDGDVIWPNEPCGGVAVIKCSADIVVKMIPNYHDYTEYTALQYLRQHAPEVSVPEPLGALVSGKTVYLFMTFIPGPTLESVWFQLPDGQKIALRNELNAILLRLRDLSTPNNGLLGGVGGEGCKDSRRRSRISQKPIRSTAEFEDFIFSNPHFGGSVYIKLLRSMSQSHRSRVFFTHGDLRPANIVVLPDEQGNYSINGILDWEMSGFYPDYWESIKATNTMAPQEENDWYLHLPACASPTSYPIAWLLDRKWDVHVA